MSSVLRKIRYVVWGEPPESKLERNLLFKIDWFVLSFTCLAFWTVALDTSNVGNAYVSGMKEELNMQGNALNILQTAWTVGYVVGMIPNNMMYLYIRPRYWMPSCIVIFGCFTLGMYRVSSWKQLIPLRFFQALFESSVFSGSHLILGSWYKKTELSKRSAIFTSSGLLAGLFSAMLQGQMHKSLNGKQGLSGWRWLFIVDFVITIVVAIYGYVLFPDTPENCNIFYFSEDELALARSRIPKPPASKLDKTVIKRVLTDWRWYLFSLLFTLGGENISWNSNTIFAQWLRWAGYPIRDRNYFPMGTSGVGVLSSFAAGIYIDLTQKVHHVAIFVSTVLLVSTIIIWVAPYKTIPIFIAHYLTGVSYAVQPSFFAWANIVITDDIEVKVVTLASMNMFSNSINAWWNIVFFGASTVPEVRKGCYAMLSTIIATPLVALVVRYLQLKQENRNKVLSENDSESQLQKDESLKDEDSQKVTEVTN